MKLILITLLLDTINAQFSYPKSTVCNVKSVPVLASSFPNSIDIVERHQNDHLIDTRVNGEPSIAIHDSIFNCSFQAYHENFHKLFPKNPTLLRLSFKSFPFAHEAPVYMPSSNELFFTSNILHDDNGKENIKMYLMDIDSFHTREIGHADIPLSNSSLVSSSVIPMANGAFKDRFDPFKLYLCSQGYGKTGGSIVHVDIRWSISHNNIHAPKRVLDNYFGLVFNSPNDIIQDSYGSLWFTDPSYGYIQGFREVPRLGSFVWWFDEKSSFSNKALKAVIIDLDKPNGLALNADESLLYVADSGFAPSNNAQKPHAVYAFDVKWSAFGPNLVNKRLFAVIDSGIPDGLKLDRMGNIYFGCGDGVQIFNPDGLLLGKIAVDRGLKVSNLAFGGKNMNQLYMMSDNTMYKTTMAVQGL